MSKKIVICPVCNKKLNGESILDEVKKDATILENVRPSKGMCKACKGVLKDSVVLVCETCDSVTGANVDKIQEYLPDSKKGDVFLIHACPGCPQEKNPGSRFVFINPESK